jgi:ribosomal protein L19
MSILSRIRPVRARELCLVMAGSAALLGLGAPSTAPALAATNPQIAGTVTSEPGAASPTTFTFTRRNGMTATINVTSSTVILRRYNAHTDIDAVSVGDSLAVWGTFEPGSTVFDATRIQDNSIQAADAYGRGTVLAVNSSANTMTVNITSKPIGSPVRNTVTVHVPAGRMIPVPQGSSIPLSSVQVGDIVLVRGVYDRSSNTFTSVDALRILKVTVVSTLQPAAISLSGYGFQRHHYAIVRIHTVAGAHLQIAIHLNVRTITIVGTANALGNFQTQRQIGYGRWYTPRHVQVVASLSTYGAQRTLIKWAWIG